jgi:hypothetical protein
VLKAIRARAKSARRCYERELAKDPKLSVKIEVALRLSSTGMPCEARVAQSNNTEVSHCVIESFRSPAFPPLESDHCADIVLPILFVPN